MKNIKIVGISAAVGFVFSFICGIFSRSPFIRKFLIALLFAIVFGILAFIINFVYSKFLNVDGGESDSSTTSVGATKSQDSNHKVDIVIAESDLEQTGNTNHYEVGDHKQMLNESDIKAQPAEPGMTDSGFVPLQNLETVHNFSGKEAVPASSTGGNKVKSSDSKPVTVMTGGSLDELPEMGDMSFLAASNQSESSQMLSENSDFISSALKYKDDNAGSVQDASLMAKAISSILSEET